MANQSGMPLDLVLVRHGESEGNLYDNILKKGKQMKKEGIARQLQSQLHGRHTASWRLTDLGRRQACRAGRLVQSEILHGKQPVEKFDKCFCSSFSRAMETAGHLGLHEVKFQVNIFLREKDSVREWERSGVMTDFCPGENVRRQQQSLSEFYGNAAGLESPADMLIRLQLFLDHLRVHYSGKRVLVVCHNHVMKAMQILLTEVPPDRLEEVWDSVTPHCCIEWYTRREESTGSTNSYFTRRIVFAMTDPQDITSETCKCKTEIQRLRTVAEDFELSNEELITAVERDDQVLNNWHWLHLNSGSSSHSKMQSRVEESTKEYQLPAALTRLNDNFPLFNLKVNGSEGLENLRLYYDICRKAVDLFVTTSCFSVWKKAKCTNGCGKLIPAVREDSDEAVRVFFFDDNINLHLGGNAGSSDTKGICNLRDVITEEYIDFTEGNNGFKYDLAFRHTLVAHSNNYKAVLVQANILDAMLNEDYFTSIIHKYSKPDEKLIVYMDVNGTILWQDSIMNLGPEELLLGTMCGFTEVRPRAPFDLKWDQQPVIRLEKKRHIKELVHDICESDDKMVHSFWTRKNAERLLRELETYAEIGWSQNEDHMAPGEFFTVFEDYMATVRIQNTKGPAAGSGVCKSWFRMLTTCRDCGHSIVMNSFGVDTHAVLKKSVNDPLKTLHVAIDFELWSERDTKKFNEQFAAEENELNAAKKTGNTAPVTSTTTTADPKEQSWFQRLGKSQANAKSRQPDGVEFYGPIFQI